ncbi:MAG TPA: GerMN domain-containing protein, partial [Ktedonobacterales bacterium]|nr:GerMN domain-containing protein [Ktedonobacterales bacterium]
EPNARNGRGEMGHRDDALPPDVEALLSRLNTDGAAWRHDVPDHARLVERIRAIPFTAPQQTVQESSDISHKGDRRMPVDANRPPYDDPSFIDWIPEPEPPRPSRPWVRAFGLVAAVVVVALLAVVFAQIALQRGGIVGPATNPTVTRSAPVATGTPAATSATTPLPTPTAKGYVVQVYFSKQPDSYNDPNAVFPVSRFSPTSGVATSAIEQLIAGPTASEKAQGYFTELSGALTGTSNCGGRDFTITLNMRASHPQTGAATLRFCRTLSLPGELTDARIKAEITKTLTQFPTITSVTIITREGHCFGDLSGQDNCLQ